MSEVDGLAVGWGVAGLADGAPVGLEVLGEEEGRADSVTEGL